MSNYWALKYYLLIYSNKIENPNINYHDTRDIFENGKVYSFTGDLRTIFEISNQKDCFNMLIEYRKKRAYYN